MEVAKMLSFENSMEAKSSSESFSSDANVGGERLTELSSNAELVLSAAIALCSLVARQVERICLVIVNLFCEFI